MTESAEPKRCIARSYPMTAVFSGSFSLRNWPVLMGRDKILVISGLVATRVVAEIVRSPIVMGASMVAIGLTLDTVGID